MHAGLTVTVARAALVMPIAERIASARRRFSEPSSLHEISLKK
jgi:hypothetical protein